MGIATEGEHAGKAQLSIFSQSETVITNLTEDTFDAARVTAMLGQMQTTAEREQHDLVAEALESRAEAGLPLPSLPAGSLPAEEWVAFGNVTKAMENVDL